jgi:hypothetical protein
MSSPGSVVSIVNDGGFAPFASRKIPAITMNGAPLSVKRFFVLYFLPVNSKKADLDQATIAVREAPTLGPEVENRAAPRTRGWEAEIHRDKFDEIARRGHHRRHVVDLDLVGLRQIALC